MPEPFVVPGLSPVQQLHAAFGRVCERLGCTAGPVQIEFLVMSMEWAATHGRHTVVLPGDLRTENGVDQLREWFLMIHKPLEYRLPTMRDSWPVRQVDPLMGG